MRYVRWILLALIVAVVCLTGVAAPVNAAVTVVPDPVPTPEILPASPVIITAYQVFGSSLQFVQLYNSSDELISLDGGHLVYSYALDIPGVMHEAVSLTGLMRPRTHVLVTVEGLLPDSSLNTHIVDTSAPTATTISSIAFTLPGMSLSQIPATLKINGSVQQRGKTSSGYSSVTFGDFSGALYADDLYDVPPPPALQIVEISPRAKDCEPFIADLTCGDFVKLKILPGYDDDSLALYRLRTDPAATSVTNSFSLAYASRQGDYVVVRLRDDGQNLSLTNGGGYIWLEDAYGERRYDETLTSYADAGSEVYLDKSWALDEAERIWKWAIPSPLSANQFPQVLAESANETVNVSECPIGKYRNPETNRCRSIEEAVSALAVCEEGKERNPLTNRCRTNGTTTSTIFTPCEEGEERNPVTNRCRSAIASSTTLAACQAGYERNSSTNRCRKSIAGSGSPTSTPAAASIDSAGATPLKSALIVTAGLGALGYGFYEWRSELWRAFRRVTVFVSGK